MQARTGNLYFLMMYERAEAYAEVSDAGSGVEVYLLDASDIASWDGQEGERYRDVVATQPLYAARILQNPFVVVVVDHGKITVGDFPTLREAARNFDAMATIHNTEGYRLGYRAIESLGVRR